VDRATQIRKTWSRIAGNWTGDDFTVQAGDAVEVTVTAAWAWDLLGAEAGSPSFDLPFHTAFGNVNWLSLPQNTAIADAMGLVQAMNANPAPGPVTKVAWLDPATGRLETLVFYAGAWRGNNFPLAPGQGVAVLLSGTLPGWKPPLYQP